MLVDNKIYELGVNDQNVFDDFLKELDGDIDIPGYDEELLKVLTAGAKEADEVINSYGKFSDEKITQMNNATPINLSPPTQTQNVQPTITTPTTQTSAVETVPSSQKFIICPKCGEKIWL